MKNNSTELFPIIDEQGHTIGKATRKECHNGSKLLHPVIHLQIFNNWALRTSLRLFRFHISLNLR